jgi:hypothetical protein
LTFNKGGKSSFWDWLGFQRHPDFASVPWLGTVSGVLLVLVAILVVVGGVATLAQFLGAVLQLDADHEAIRNTGLILVAVLGAPFVVWRATVAQKQADTAEQSHITDQINKAVAGLGTEKVVNRIGRPVKVFTGKYKDIEYIFGDSDSIAIPPKSREISRIYKTDYKGGTEEIFTGWYLDVREWEDEKTVIEWEGSALAIDKSEAIAEVGDWAVFSETPAQFMHWNEYPKTALAITFK